MRVLHPRFCQEAVIDQLRRRFMNRYPPTTLWSVATMWSAASLGLACYSATIAAMTNVMRRPGAPMPAKPAVAKSASVTISRPMVAPVAPVEREPAPEKIMAPETGSDAPSVKVPERPATQMSLGATSEFSPKPVAQDYPAKKKKPRPGQGPVAQAKPKIVDPGSPSTK
jgi:hypothetical protein